MKWWTIIASGYRSSAGNFVSGLDYSSRPDVFNHHTQAFLESKVDKATGLTTLKRHPSTAACWRNDQYLVAWQSDQGTAGKEFAIYARYLDGDANLGIVVKPSAFSISNFVEAGCDYTGRQYLLAWQVQWEPSEYGSRHGIDARQLNSDGSMSEVITIANPIYMGGLGRSDWPAVSGGKENWLVAWSQLRFFPLVDDIFGQLVGFEIYLPLVKR